MPLNCRLKEQNPSQQPNKPDNSHVLNLNNTFNPAHLYGPVRRHLQISHCLGFDFQYQHLYRGTFSLLATSKLEEPSSTEHSRAEKHPRGHHQPPDTKKPGTRFPAISRESRSPGQFQPSNGLSPLGLECGAACENRTRDLLITSEMLYRLS